MFKTTAYKKLCSLINEGHSPLKIVNARNTKCLSIICAVNLISDQWIELKCHFEIARNADRCYD